MKAKKVLFITQEITPYVPESPMSLMGRKLPQAVQERGREIRTFTPKWGVTNERRNQLHEVIRLSGMNMIIDDTDHPLIIKVASIQSARMQVYFGNDLSGLYLITYIHKYLADTSSRLRSDVVLHIGLNCRCVSLFLRHLANRYLCHSHYRG